MSSAAPVYALEAGDILVGYWPSSILRLDSVPSEASTATGFRVSPFFTRLSVDAAGVVYLLDGYRAALFRIDPTTRAISIVSNALRGGGPLMVAATAFVSEPGGSLWVADHDGHRVLRVDPETGDREVLELPAGVESVIDLAFEPVLGTLLALDHATPSFYQPIIGVLGALVRIDPFPPSHADLNERAQYYDWGVTTTPDGRIYVTQCCGPVSPVSIVRIDPDSGVRSEVSSSELGSGPQFAQLSPIHALSELELLVADFDSPTDTSRLMRVQIDTGDRSVASGPGVGDGPGLAGGVRDIALGPGNDCYALDAEGIMHVDLVTGNRERWFEFQVGSAASQAELVVGSIAAIAGKPVLFVGREYPFVERVYGVDPVTRDSAPLASGAEDPSPMSYSLRFAHRLLPDGDALAFGSIAGDERNTILRIDGRTGERSVFARPHPGGPSWSQIEGVAVAPGAIFVSDSDRVFRVDVHQIEPSLVSIPSVVSSYDHGTGEPAAFYRLAVAPSGELFSSLSGKLLRIDPVTGDRTIASGDGVGAGPILRTPIDIDATADGRILVLQTLRPDDAGQELLSIDPETGDRERLAIGEIESIAVVPEPGAGLLAMAAFAALAAREGSMRVLRGSDRRRQTIR